MRRIPLGTGNTERRPTGGPAGAAAWPGWRSSISSWGNARSVPKQAKTGKAGRRAPEAPCTPWKEGEAPGAERVYKAPRRVLAALGLAPALPGAWMTSACSEGPAGKQSLDSCRQSWQRTDWSVWSHPSSASAGGKQRRAHKSHFPCREHPPGPHSRDQLCPGPGWGCFRPQEVLKPRLASGLAGAALHLQESTLTSADVPCGRQRSQGRTEGQVHF